jgi:hypothetical protein
VFVRRTRILLAGVLVATLPLGAGAAQARHHRRRHGGPLPSIGAQPRPSIFGIDTGTYDSVYPDFVRDIPAAKSLGARWDHVVLGPATGRGNFSTEDYQVRRARQLGMGVVLSFGGIAGACSQPTADVQACPPTSAHDRRAYRAYVRRVLVRYRRVVTYYESWVEPNNAGKFLPRANPGEYAMLLRLQYAVVQSVNRRYHTDLKLLFGSPINFSYIPGMGSIAVLPFAARVLDALHGQRPFDGVALHAYRFPPASEGPAAGDCDYVGRVSVRLGYSTRDCPAPSWRLLTWPQELTAYEQVFENHGYGQVSLWLTEFGWPGNSRPSGVYLPGEHTQTLYLTEAYADLLRLPFVHAALWFNLRDYEPGYPTGDPAFFYHYGLLDYGFVPKPAALAFAALARANPGR